MRRSFAILLVALVGLALAARARAETPECMKALNEGAEYSKKDEYAKALECFQRAVKADPKSGYAMYCVGGTLADLKRWDESEVALEKALQLEPVPGRIHRMVYRVRGISCGMREMWDKSLEWTKKALDISPYDGGLLMNLGTAYDHLNKPKEAIEAWEKALQIDPSNPNAKDCQEWIEDCKEKLGGGPVTPPPGSDGAFGLSSSGAFVLAPDRKTLYVAGRGQLMVFDCTESKELKRVWLNFRPNRIALQGKILVATARGDAQVHVVELDTGKVQKPIKVPGDPLNEIVCGAKGLVYVNDLKDQVFAVDPKTGTATKTDARARRLAIDDPGSFVYAASVTTEKGAQKTTLRKYAPKGKGLSPAATNGKALEGGIVSLTLSPDGKRIALVGEPVKPKAEGEEPGPAPVKVLSTDDLVTPTGQIDFGAGIDTLAFHPILPRGAALKGDGTVVHFDTKTSAQTATAKVDPAPMGPHEPGRVEFVARGAKLVCWQPSSDGRKDRGTLTFFPLELKPEEKEQLEKASPAEKASPPEKPSSTDKPSSSDGSPH
jgi:hypothetical protein